jgi:hypothetical protein
MYATIIQHIPIVGTKPDGTPDSGASALLQTAVVAVGNEVLVFNRVAGKRGTVGAWKQGHNLHGYQLVVGAPVSNELTPTDLSNYFAGKGLAVVFQKLVRRVEGVTTIGTEEAETVIQRVMDEATSNPSSLAKYIAGVPLRVSEPVVPTLLPQAPLEPTVAPLPALDEPLASPSTIPSGLWASLSTPSRAEVAGYIERTIDGLPEHAIFDYARSQSKAVTIFGHAGTGKTSSARHYAGLRGLPFTVFECNPQVDEEVVQGTWIPTGNGTELAWRYSELATALTQPSVVLINESNRMSAKANALFLRILQERELQVTRHKNETLKVHPECLIVSDSNPGYRGTVASDQAFLDRFAVRLEYKYDTELEKHFIPSSELLYLAQTLREQAEREDRWTTPVSTRLLKNFVDDARGLGFKFAVRSFVDAFPVEERDALRMVVEVHSDLIATELGVTA